MTLIAIASPLFRVILTDKWLPSVPIFQWLCVSGLGWGLSAINLNILQVKGRSDLFLYLEIAKKLFLISVLAFTLQFGVLWMVRGMVLVTAFSVVLNLYFSGKEIDYGFREQVQDIAPYFLVIIFAASISYWVGQYIRWQVVALFTQLFIASAIIFGASSVLKLEALMECKSIVYNELMKFRGLKE
jgi:O-antigen/teichoic acid export membrane protein